MENPGKKRGEIEKTTGRVNELKRTVNSGSFWGASVFVWGIWSLLLLASLGFIAKYHTSVPYGEDWTFVVPPITGVQPLSLGWYWEADRTHRLPLWKLIIVPLFAISRGDYWAPMLFSVFSLGGLAFVLICSAKRSRGWTSYSDAFFPLALLHWELSSTLLFASAITQLLPALLACVILLVIVQKGTQLTTTTGLLAGICLVLLPACGGYGMVFLPALTSWFVYSGICALRSNSPSGKRIGLLILILAFMTFAHGAIYFLNLPKEVGTQMKLAPSWRAMTVTGLALLTESFGSAFLSPSVWPYGLCGMVVLLMFSAGFLVSIVWRERGLVRSRALGLLFFLSALATLAVVFARTRAVGDSVDGAAGIGMYRYYTVWTIPTLVYLYFAWGIGKRQAIGQFAHMCLFALSCFAFSLNVQYGLEDMQQYYSWVQAFEHDLAKGEPSYILVERYHQTISPYAPEDYMLDAMRSLKQSKIGIFRDLKDPSLAEQPFDGTMTDHQKIDWEGSTAHGQSSESYITYSFSSPTFIAGIRLRYTYSSPTQQNTLQIFWKKTGDTDFSEGVTRTDVLDCATVFIGETISQIRIHPDNKPFDFEITEIMRLVPESGDR